MQGEERRMRTIITLTLAKKIREEGPWEQILADMRGLSPFLVIDLTIDIHKLFRLIKHKCYSSPLRKLSFTLKRASVGRMGLTGIRPPRFRNNASSLGRHKRSVSVEMRLFDQRLHFQKIPPFV